MDTAARYYEFVSKLQLTTSNFQLENGNFQPAT